MGGFRQKTPHRLLKVAHCQLLPSRLLPRRTLPPLGAPCLLSGSVPPRSLYLLSPLPSHSGLLSLCGCHMNTGLHLQLRPCGCHVNTDSHLQLRPCRCHVNTGPHLQLRPLPKAQSLDSTDITGTSRGLRPHGLGGRPSSSLRPRSRPRDSPPSPLGYSVSCLHRPLPGRLLLPSPEGHSTSALDTPPSFP